MTNTTGIESSTSSVACKLLGREFMQRKEEITNALFRHAEGVEELADGFAFRFAGSTLWRVESWSSSPPSANAAPSSGSS